MVTKANLKTLSTSEMETFPQVATRYRGKFHLSKHLRWSFFQKQLKTEPISAKTFIVDVWQGYESASEFAGIQNS